ncbi:alpha/beta hydrolase [Staphylococcus sp. SQ8-PEA]|uniref:Alpha/beta hydrolase n=1 Tax=Staphylococcus marylandisciuri TaxID=2981529 RepID=A0ABT2QP50_9STAP|nr:alpha/beta hydrolase [Staphylococcus marylandisciuri]MCU5745758.1 alpha/beta hydrolase [Staphylococcus marylandisciuri]
MQNQRKWRFISFSAIIIVALVVALLLKINFDRNHTKDRQEEVQINNKNVNLFTNINYSKAFPNSRLDIITPSNMEQDNKLPVIFWTHGGGYIAGDKQYKNPLLAKIAEQGYIVVNINYALAPNNKYPTQLKQINDAVSFIKQNKHDLPIDFDQVVFGGDSAGAQMASQYTAMQTNQSLREEMYFDKQFNADQIKAVILYGGFYNMKTVRATEFPRIQLFMESYTGEKDWENQFKNITQMSTINQITKDYPPTYLSVGDRDPFDSQNRAFAKKLRSKGISTETLFYNGSHKLHHQYQFHLNLPESKTNIKDTLKFLSRNTKSSGVETEIKPEDEGLYGVELNPY